MLAKFPRTLGLILFVELVLFLVLFTIATAQGNGPSFTTVSEIRAGQTTAAKIQGSNFTTPVTATVSLPGSDPRMGVQWPASRISDTLIQITVTRGTVAGSYNLCLFFSNGMPCKPLQIEPAAQIKQVSPLPIYNTRERQIRIVGSGLTTPLSVTLASQILKVDSVGSTATGTTIVIATVPSSFSPGNHPVKIVLNDGTVITASQPLEVKGPISATVTDLNPKELLTPLEKTTVTLTGQNLNGERPTTSFLTCDNGTQLPLYNVSAKADGGELYLTWSAFNLPLSPKAGQYSNCRLPFADDSDVKLPSFQIWNRVFPWDASSSLRFILLFLSAIGTCAVIYSRSTRDHQTYLLNQSSPDLIAGLDLTLRLINISALVVAIILGVYSAVTYPGAITWEFAAIAGIVAINVGLAFIFALLTGKFYPTAPNATRYIIASALALIACAIPIFFSARAVGPAWLAVLAELALTIVIADLGLVGTYFAYQKLKQRRYKGPSPEEIQTSVEQLLYRQGQVKLNEDLKTLPRDRVLDALRRYYTIHSPAQGLSFDESAGTLALYRREAITRLSEDFAAVRNALDHESQPAALNQLVSDLWQNYKFQQGSAYSLKDVPQVFRVLSAHSVELESVLPNPFPWIMFMAKVGIAPDQIKELQAILNQLDVPSRFAVLLAIQEPVATRNAIRENLGGIGRENVAVLGERDCLNILASREEIRAGVMQVIQEQVDLTIFSPYQIVAPTSLDMFYGRTKELNMVLETIDKGSVAVLGARRIGKTSMLQAAQHLLEERGKYLLYLDCYHINEYQAFLSEVRTRWADRISGLQMSGYTAWSDFARFVVDLQKLHHDQDLVFQLDEIDRLLAYDMDPSRDELLFRMFRSLAQEKRCQFIFSGERTILDQLANPKSAFYNFPHEIRLGLLEHEDAYKLVEEPMSLVRAELEKREELLALIFDQTSGHPNLIQFICEQVLRGLERTKTRLVTANLMKEVTNTRAYRDLYLQTFWSQATPLEKAISICVAEGKQVTEEQILKRLEQVGFSIGINELNRGVRYLTLSQLVIPFTEGYRIQPQMFLPYVSPFSFDQWLHTFRKEMQSS